MPKDTLVIVESPAKAKTINRYLGSGYNVIASYGHIRDLPPKDGSVDPDQDFAMQWEVDARSRKHLDAVIKACKNADQLYFATDPDREGEAISWHLKEELNKRKLLDKCPSARVVFHEITKSAILTAIKNPRQIDDDMVSAYLARRALDYLVGFTLSPVLWRKLPGAKSAGRVQSVSLRIICEREEEIESFKPQEYWSLDTALLTEKGDLFQARPFMYQGKNLQRLSIKSKVEATAIKEAITTSKLTISAVESKIVNRNPQPPFTTSSLQQEASRKLRFSASKTMQVAQKLYEGINLGGEASGLITYMRTDSISMSQEALHSIRDVIKGQFGDQYLPPSTRQFKTKSKSAQEAHEAVRPTDANRHPNKIASYLNSDERALYELIWKRAVASQMAVARFNQARVDIMDQSGQLGLRANGQIMVFDGFIKLYREDRDEPDTSKGEEQFNDDSNRELPTMNKGENAQHEKTDADQHFTQPPPRYSEASLVKKMEEIGIGRPSTYAPTLKVLQDRAYVTLDKRRFMPEARGRLVTSFLSGFFAKYVDYDFTASLEKELDSISDGKLLWKSVISKFWNDFKPLTDEIKNLPYQEIMRTLDEGLGEHLFDAMKKDPSDNPRKCLNCGGRLGLNVGKFGAYASCSNYPECRFTRPLFSNESDNASGDDAGDNGIYPKILGINKQNNADISLRKGPYGFYVQEDLKPSDTPEKEAEAPKPIPDEKNSKPSKASKAKKVKKKAAPKPKRSSLLKGQVPDEITLDIALDLLSLPRLIGVHPDTKENIQAGIGRFGPFLKLGARFINLPASDDVLSIGMNRAMEVIAQASEGKAGRELGAHPDDGAMILVKPGRYGPYVAHGGINASLPRGMEIDEVTVDEAVRLLTERKAKGGGKKTKAKKISAKKTTVKKTATKKPTAKKATSKKPA